MTNTQGNEPIKSTNTTDEAIDAARWAIDEHDYQRAIAFAAIAQAEALSHIEDYLSSLAAYVNHVG